MKKEEIKNGITLMKLVEMIITTFELSNMISGIEEVNISNDKLGKIKNGKELMEKTIEVIMDINKEMKNGVNLEKKDIKNIIDGLEILTKVLKEKL